MGKSKLNNDTFNAIYRLSCIFPVFSLQIHKKNHINAYLAMKSSKKII